MKKNKLTFINHFIPLMIILIALMCCSKEDKYIYELENFKLISPSNNTNYLILDNIELKWNGLHPRHIGLPYSKLTIGITPSYEVILWEKETNKQVLQETVIDNNIAVKYLKGSTIYQWKVKVWANNEIISESDIWEFKTEPKTFRGNVSFSTQSEIDTFKKNDYRRIFGNLDIIYSNIDPIKDLSSLSVISTIKGDLNLTNTKLTSFNFFTDIDSLGGSLVIKDNDELTSIIGFNKLKYIGGSLNISNNNKLLNIQEFSSLKTLGESLVVIGNDKLKSICDFNVLDSIKWGLTVENNALLENVFGFENIVYIRGEFYFVGNNSLEAIKGFENLYLIGEEKYYISKNMEIRYNLKLSAIPNFNKLRSIGGNFEILSSNLSSLNGFESLTSIAYDFSIENNDLLKSIPFFNNLARIGGSFSIGWNALLDSIQGFENLKTIGSAFSIDYNDKISTISGLNRLEKVENNYSISNNEKLTTINSFNSLHDVANIWITNNYELNSFCFLKPLISSNLYNTYNLFSNKTNPTVDEIKWLICE